VHDELFTQGTADVVWLREAGVREWVVITRDDRIRYNQLEKQAVLAARLRFQHHIVVVDGRPALILSALGRISRLSRQHAAYGVIATVSRRPDVRIVEAGGR